MCCLKPIKILFYRKWRKEGDREQEREIGSWSMSAHLLGSLMAGSHSFIKLDSSRDNPAHSYPVSP